MDERSSSALCALKSSQRFRCFGFGWFKAWGFWALVFEGFGFRGFGFWGFLEGILSMPKLCRLESLTGFLLRDFIYITIIIRIPHN